MSFIPQRKKKRDTVFSSGRAKQMKIEENRLVVKAQLLGKRFVEEDALIDTGAAFSVIPPEIDDFLELEPHEIPKTKLITASGIIEPEVKILEKIVVGEITMEKLPVVIHEIPDPAPIKILLGMNFIKNVDLRVNGKENVFNIEDP